MTEASSPERAVGRPDPRALLYPREYGWYLVASTLDIVVTYVIVWSLGGREVNAVAARLIEKYGHWGLIGLKFATVVLVVLICETIGRQRPKWGRRLAIAAIVISAMPVGMGLLQVAAWTHLLR